MLMACLALVGTAAEGSFQFREPEPRTYRLVGPVGLSGGEETAAGARAVTEDAAWLDARTEPGGAFVQLGRRIVLRLTAPDTLEDLLAGTPLKPARQVTKDVFILEAPDALTATREAARLATLPGVQVCHPVRRRQVGLHGSFAAHPDDPYYDQAWHLEHRDLRTAAALRPDLNIRAAWPLSRGAGVVVAVVDNGFEITHPDLAPNARNSYHFNFHTGVKDGRPMTTQQNHATAVAGLIAAAANNGLGVTGVAPEAQLASWVIFDSLDSFIDEEAAMDMFQYEDQEVDIQNHSWGNVGVQQLPLGTLEEIGIDHAITQGRGARGVIFVRAAGNDRTAFNDVNDDGYGQDPRAITVGAVRNNGRVASYSTPGAPVLVAGFSGDRGVDVSSTLTTNYPTLTTTDRSGSLGYNRSSVGDQGDYAFGNSGFSGTSAATPLISGICALMLSANPELTYRDVQQILILAARQLDPADPDLQRNGAGFWVSHNVGFGVPDPAHAVALARQWPNRPPRAETRVKSNATRLIPDDGLRLHVTGLRVPSNLEYIPASPVDGLHPLTATEFLKLVDVGPAQSSVKEDLHGKAALIQRGGNYFVEKLQYAVDAGAAFAVIYNNTGGNERFVPNGADIHLIPIPAVFIGQNDGEDLAEFVRLWRSTEARIEMNSVGYDLKVTDTFQCEHVGLRVKGSHARRGDVRITLTSPSGTVSILQRLNDDTLSALSDWTYYSVHHFFEPTAGEWHVAFTDERTGVSGRITSVELTIYGVPIKDGDHDGLDDDWERIQVGTRFEGPADDHDHDGASNLYEALAGTDPRRADRGSGLDFTYWDDRVVRLSWPSVPGVTYRISVFEALGAPPLTSQDVLGIYPETSWYGPLGEGPQRFYSVTPLTP